MDTRQRKQLRGIIERSGFEVTTECPQVWGAKRHGFRFCMVRGSLTGAQWSAWVERARRNVATPPVFGDDPIHTAAAVLARFLRVELATILHAPRKLCGECMGTGANNKSADCSDVCDACGGDGAS